METDQSSTQRPPSGLRERVATDPDSPRVGATPSDDTPLVIESGDKLPAGNEASHYYNWLLL
jgi:hypothetical protein